MNKILQNKKGSISIVLLFLIGAMIPTLIFSTLEFIQATQTKQKVINLTDNSLNQALYELDEDRLQYGDIEILENEAENKIKTIFQENFSLDTNMQRTEKSLIQSNPTIKTYFFNKYSEEGEVFITDEGARYVLYEPSIILYANIRTLKLFGIYSANLELTRKRTVSFKKEKETYEIISTPDSTQDIQFFIDEVRNPYHFNEDNPFYPLEWSFPVIPMLSGTQVNFSFQFRDEEYSETTTRATVHLNGETRTGTNYQRTINAEIVKKVDVSTLNLFPVSPDELGKSAWGISNPYNFDIIITWLGETQEGKVIATANSETYFQIDGDFIVAHTYGEELSDLQTNNESVINPTLYDFVDNNNGTGLFNGLGFRGNFLIPQDTPDDTLISIEITSDGRKITSNANSNNDTNNRDNPNSNKGGNDKGNNDGAGNTNNNDNHIVYTFNEQVIGYVEKYIKEQLIFK